MSVSFFLPLFACFSFTLFRRVFPSFSCLCGFLSQFTAPSSSPHSVHFSVFLMFMTLSQCHCCLPSVWFICQAQGKAPHWLHTHTFTFTTLYLQVPLWPKPPCPYWFTSQVFPNLGSYCAPDRSHTQKYTCIPAHITACLCTQRQAQVPQRHTL